MSNNYQGRKTKEPLNQIYTKFAHCFLGWIKLRAPTACDGEGLDM